MVSPPDPAAPTSQGDRMEGSPQTTAALLEQLRQDRLWLLRQLDSGQWSRWRLDLAALERELGQLLDLASDRDSAQ